MAQNETTPDGLAMHVPGAKADNGKPDASLLRDFGRALLAVAEVGTFGKNKYTRGGWQEVTDGYNRYSAALIRHFIKAGQEELDNDSGLLHDAHMVWNALASLELKLRAIEEEATSRQVEWPTYGDKTEWRNYIDEYEVFAQGLQQQENENDSNQIGLLSHTLL